jgi:hypothetical protein
MEQHSVQLAAGRVVTVFRDPPKPTDKKKSTKPPHHDIDMCCVTWAWMSDRDLAGELLKRAGVKRVVVTSKGNVTELQN